MDRETVKGYVRPMIAILLMGAAIGAQTAQGQAWQPKDAGNYNWNDAANWSGAIPNARGAAAKLELPARGTMTITLDRPVTLGGLDIGETGAGTLTLGGSNPLTFEGASAGAGSFINLTQGNVPNGMRLDLAGGLRLGGSSPLTATIVSPTFFDCAIREVALGANTFTLKGTRRFNMGAGWHGVNWQIGKISGSGSFVQNGAGTTLQSDCPDFTGTLTVNNGDFNGSRLPAVSQYVVAGAFMNKDKYPRGGVLNLSGGHEAASRTITPRLNPKATLILQGGGSFVINGQVLDETAFVGALRPAVVEHLRQIQFQCGMSEFALENGNNISSSTTLLVTDPTQAMVRQQGATVMFSGDGTRTTQGYWAALGVAEKVLFASGMTSQLKGAGGPPGSRNRSIIPWITIGTVYHPAEGGLATYDDMKGVHCLREEEYDEQLAGTPDRNVRSGQLNLGSNKTQTVNSLCYTSWGNSDIGAGSTITITSGALMMGSMGGASIGGTPGQAGTINFGPAEGVIWPPFVTPYGKDIMIGSVIAGSGGLAKSATSALILTAANTYTGKTCVAAGTLQVGDGTAATSRLGDGDLEVANGATLSIKAKVANAIVDTATVTLHHAGTAFYGMMDLDSGVNETVGTLVLDGKPQPAGTYGSKASAATHKLDNYFSGAGVLTVTGKTKARP